MNIYLSYSSMTSPAQIATIQKTINMTYDEQLAEFMESDYTAAYCHGDAYGYYLTTYFPNLIIHSSQYIDTVELIKNIQLNNKQKRRIEDFEWCMYIHTIPADITQVFDKHEGLLWQQKCQIEELNLKIDKLISSTKDNEITYLNKQLNINIIDIDDLKEQLCITRREVDDLKNQLHNKSVDKSKCAFLIQRYWKKYILIKRIKEAAQIYRNSNSRFAQFMIRPLHVTEKLYDDLMYCRSQRRVRSIASEKSIQRSNQLVRDWNN
jgi:hypothetical protein